VQLAVVAMSPPPLLIGNKAGSEDTAAPASCTTPRRTQWRLPAHNAVFLRHTEMNRKHALIALIVVTALGLGALVGYWGGRRARTSPFVSDGPAAKQMAGCVDFHDAEAHVGESGCVSGRVLKVYNSKSGTTFLDFCADYRTCPFRGVVFASEQSRFADLGSLTGRQVEVRGSISAYQGHAEIIIHHPEQIRALP
jgi:hypothetical protein